VPRANVVSTAIIAATISNRDLDSGDQPDMKPASELRSSGRVPTLDEAKAAFRAEYVAWKGCG
jgi:hypothetical protein